MGCEGAALRERHDNQELRLRQNLESMAYVDESGTDKAGHFGDSADYSTTLVH